MTVNEYRHEIETAEFLGAWLEANKGKLRDRTKKADGSSGGTSGSGMFGNKKSDAGNGNGNGEQKRSLFGNKK